MEKTVDTVVEDVYNLLEQGCEVSEVYAAEFGKRMAALLVNRLKREERKRGLRMSSIGKSDAEIWYEYKGYPAEPLEPKARLKFLYGDLIEEMLLSLVELSGHHVADRQKEVELEGVKGHLDATIDGTLVDVKSASQYGFQKFLNGDLGSDSFGYIMQISGYAQAEGKSKAAFLAMDKSSGDITLMRVDQVADAASRIRYLHNILAKDQPPKLECVVKREDNGNEYLGSPDCYSPHKFNYYPDLRVFQYSTGPRYFTKVNVLPRVVEITDEAKQFLKKKS